ncbi:protein saal1 isoform X2 [Lampris incognitus]|nr:protein saal1 isoform X2 [Lampris incognitus]
MDRNPSPPPDTDEGQEEAVDTIGETVYSKHWLFSTLTRLIQLATEQEKGAADAQMELTDNDEEDLCIVWDMATDKDVAGFLQEFKAADILLGVIAKSRCPRLTEICVGILGNIACFPDTCVSLSQNEDLGAVLLLLFGDTDPPTLLETSRLLLTCVSQKDVCPLWLQRIRQQKSVCPSLCFIMSSSTNIDLLVKVGELMDKLFDLDEELMRSWITAQQTEEEEACERYPDLASSLLEAAKQLRSESSDGLEVYLHIFQLLTTIVEGIQTLAVPEGPGRDVWDFLCNVVCEDLCQPDKPSLVLQEQKVLLFQALAVLSALYRCQDQLHNLTEKCFPLVGSIFQVLHYCKCQEDKTEDCNDSEDAGKEEPGDVHLVALVETTSEFLADIFVHITKDTVAEMVKKGFLTEKTCLSAVSSLLPQYKCALQHLESLLSETDPQLADVVRKGIPV